MTTHVALLRGINVGASTKVPMADLRGLVSELGYERVRTHLQSGNLLLDSTQSQRTVRDRLHRELSKRFGFDIRLVVRDRSHLAATVARDPFNKIADDPARYFVVFCDPAPDPAKAADLDPDDYLPEQFTIAGDTIYYWLPKGMHQAKLPLVLSERRFGGTLTARNWRTVTKLLDLADA